MLDELGDDTWFYPGPGDESTIGAGRGGAGRPKLPGWKGRGW